MGMRRPIPKARIVIFKPGSRLPPLVFTLVNQPHDLFDDPLLESPGGDMVHAQLLLNRKPKNVIQDLIVGQSCPDLSGSDAARRSAAAGWYSPE